MKIRHLTIEDSSNVQSVAYDPADHKLIVRFRSGGLYVYDNVEPGDFALCISADSVGKEMQRYTRHPDKHPVTKLEAGAADDETDVQMAIWDAHLEALRRNVVELKFSAATLELARMLVQVEKMRGTL